MDKRMALLTEESLANIAEQRESFRLINVSSKLNRSEVQQFDSLAKKRGFPRGELIRQLILRELRQDASESTARLELTEIIGLRLMLTNLLKPIATGQRITPDVFEAIMAEVRKAKREIALEAQQQAGGL
jgi:Ribbon-helix-helix protein, copG family